ncbi:hypothetical protein FQK07_00335 [Synechococcus sp. BSF8S]|uniref:hypothetical protein n=1 Tax=Synechococcales TaxID=1890424 RepID=UPI001627776C|nr:MULTISPECIES: hypothetical protein [unclassified Synechococcus]MBC1259733.1 hypothetical protein [Synechococcus sp. BSF8S]MBC1262844.1 hypothetical protein [Synechococcus sp. BSA11S]
MLTLPANGSPDACFEGISSVSLAASYVPLMFRLNCALREGTALRITTEGHCFNAYRERVQITIDVKT